MATLNTAEVFKLLKDHGFYPTLITKEEVSQIIRLVNMRGGKDVASSELQALTYNGFRVFLVQIAIHAFSRPPKDLSSQPLLKSLEALISVFEESTKKRGLSTLLYDDVEGTAGLSQKDKELIKQLN